MNQFTRGTIVRFASGPNQGQYGVITGEQQTGSVPLQLADGTNTTSPTHDLLTEAGAGGSWTPPTALLQLAKSMGGVAAGTGA